MENIVNLNGSQFQTGEQAVNDAIESLCEGDFKNCNKVLILGVNDSDPDELMLSYVRGGVTESEMIVMLEAFKSKIMYNLGY